MNKINNSSLNIKNVDQTITVYGFVANKRKMGEINFIDLRDASGIVQIVINGKLENVTKESVLQVTGVIRERKDKNPNLPTGDIEIMATQYEVLSFAQNELPFVIRDDVESKEETRLQYRYLDLRRNKMQQIIKTRHIVNKAFRDFLNSCDFLEIETPILSKSTPEGARDFLVPTRKNGDFFALPQSPQLYKQLLMSSGFEKYFQIARVFRDEDSRKDRQPEFTQLDMELAYVNEKEIKKLVEQMMQYVLDKVNVNVTIPFATMTYDAAMNDYGSDKPDLRYEYKLIDVKGDFHATTFNVFKQAQSIKMIKFDKVLSNKQIKVLEEVAKKNGAKGLAFVKRENNELLGPGSKFFATESNELFNEQEGTLLFVADELAIVNKALGAVRVELNNMFNLANNEFNFVWIEEWPLFEKTESGYAAMHHPFTAPALASQDDFSSDHQSARARAYDLVLNGFELGGGSIRINNFDVQIKMFEALGIDKATYQSQFGFFLEAFKFGLPPHAGIAFGVDRLIMIIENTNSIRDVIAFPKNTNGQGVLEGSPSHVSDDQLEEYNISKKKQA